MKNLNRYAIAALVGSFALSGAALAGDDKLDANADGKVTAAEMDAAYTTSKPGVGAAKVPSSAEKIKALDTDGDGALSSVEHEAGSRTMFDQLDANKDGSLTAEEIKAGHEVK